MVERLDIERIQEFSLMSQLMAAIEDGKSDADVMIELGLDVDKYREIKKRAMRREGQYLKAKTKEELYAEYVLNQSSCVKDLTNLSKDFKKSKNYSAMVSAVRARSEIYDKIIKTGQDFGIIEKKAERTEHLIGVMIGKLSDDELRQTIVGELSNLQNMMGRFGEQDIIDVEPGPIYRSLPQPKISKKDENKSNKRSNKAKANKVHRGRKRKIKGG